MFSMTIKLSLDISHGNLKVSNNCMFDETMGSICTRHLLTSRVSKTGHFSPKTRIIARRGRHFSVAANHARHLLYFVVN